MPFMRTPPIDDDAPTFERMRRTVSRGDDRAENRGPLKGRYGSATHRKRHRGHARRMTMQRVPKPLAKLLGL